MKRFRDKPLDFDPGTKWTYCNSNYVLLGYLLEKVSGETYQKFLQENVFTPLGMKDSGYDSNSTVILDRASGYSPSKDGIVNSGYIDMTIPFSAGGLYSTTEDLLKWERGLFGGKVLKPAALQTTTTPDKQDYACGMMVTNENGHKKISHGGGIEGFNTEVDYWPEDHVTVIVLGNLNGEAPSEIAAQLGAVMHREKVTLSSERTEIKVPIKTLQDYVGVYDVAPNVTMEITLVDDHLETQLGKQPKFPIFADAQLTFGRDGSGKVTQVTLHQAGHVAVWKRK